MAQKFLHIFNETKLRIPRKQLAVIHSDLFKKKCELNLIITTNSFTKKLNATYRNKDTPASVLSFPSIDGPAEIYMAEEKILEDAKKENIKPEKRILFLYIHGILHLLGYQHGAKMDKLEDRYTKKYITKGNT